MTNDKNRSHGKIDKLPEEVKKKVEDKLLAGETYEDISGYLKEQGEDVSYSAVGRYGRNFLNRFESVRIAKEFAKLLAEDGVDRPATELHEANNLLASQIMMQAMIDDKLSGKERAAIAKSVASLQNAQVGNERLKQNARKESGAVHVAMELFKDKVFAELGEQHPEIASTLLALAEETEQEMSNA